jgi:hypothetical protein
MEHNPALGAVLNRGLASLRAQQCKDGGFDSYICDPSQPGRALEAPPTTIIPAMILGALTFVNHPATPAIAAPLAKWVLSRKSPAWTFPYWSQEVDLTHDRLLSANLHSTFVALSALYAYDPQSITSTALGNIAKLLISAESSVGGPYYTYTHTLARTTRPEIDLAANGAIGHFIAQVAAPLPNLVAFVQDAVQAHHLQSRSFTSPYAGLYCIATLVEEALRPELAAYILAQQHQGSWGSVLDTALALATLGKLGASAPARALTTLAAQQQADGSWPAQACCIAPNCINYGASALTTAIALEALSRHAHMDMHPAAATSAPTAPPTALSHADQKICQLVIGHANEELGQLPPPLRKLCLKVAQQIYTGDTSHEIVLVGRFTAQSLRAPMPRSNTSFFVSLGLANLYNWMAYTIYDDFLDDEGDPQLLSVANVALRSSVYHFCKALPTDAAFQQLVRQYFAAVDAANAWEITQARGTIREGHITLGRLPTYTHGTQLANRSCTHSLPMCAALAKAGIALHSPAAQACIQAFRHYLIARQLNDDMHDWEDDMQAGHITYVCSKILDQLQIGPQTTRLSPLLDRMRRQFWDHTLEQICRDISHHVQLGQQAAMRSKLLNHDNILSSLLRPLAATADFSLAERQRGNDFLNSYHTQ